ncbi:DUF1405 domain-containing protein [Thermanaeromonas sp. C210]|uniref:DUF1405 domain-containing protein n=1 Tax=Thermanaeromonas sp. C210 TaxID=2731925 RepID=UPI00155C9073|nr:DUF1405 domain-containing protein [Thermanaeromonas sp. C210]GFN22723.1 hypothetical protein TAMC210_10400 [Thermanaeromonas sp. C210]
MKGRGLLAWCRELLWENPHQPWFLKTLLGINFLGSLYGYYWYREQLAATPRIWWVFTPDSPLSTSLFTLALALALKGKENPFLRLLAAAGVIKYGLWAAVVITDYWLKGGPVEPLEAMLFLSHLGMALEGFIFVHHWPAGFRQVLGIGIWLGLNDYVDYALGWHPYLFRPDQEVLAAVTAVALSSLLILCFSCRKMAADQEY